MKFEEDEGGGERRDFEDGGEERNERVKYKLK